MSVVEVAQQMGNNPAVALGTYAHVFDETGRERVDAASAIYAAREEWAVRSEYAEADEPAPLDGPDLALVDEEADARTRTADPFITREVRGREVCPRVSPRGRVLPANRHLALPTTAVAGVRPGTS